VVFLQSWHSEGSEFKTSVTVPKTKEGNYLQTTEQQIFVNSQLKLKVFCGM
jgi:hypothetical protein